MSLLRAVIFDLDDTLFDTAGAMLTALDALTRTVPIFRGRTGTELFAMHTRYMHQIDPEVFSGQLNGPQARVKRFTLMLAECGAPDADGNGVSLAYRAIYRASFRQMPGAGRLLEELRRRGLKVGVLTNYLREVQLETLESIGLLPLLDALVTVSDAPPKPHPASYGAICKALDVSPQQAVMVGDNWTNDVAGAVEAGLRAVWYAPAEALAPEERVLHGRLSSYEPQEAALQVILG